MPHPKARKHAGSAEPHDVPVVEWLAVNEELDVTPAPDGLEALNDCAIGWATYSYPVDIECTGRGDCQRQAAGCAPRSVCTSPVSAPSLTSSRSQ
jgi:hypothetical protein